MKNNKHLKQQNTKFDIPIVTLSTEDNITLTKQLNEGFKREESNKNLRENAFKIASNPKYDGYERGLGSMVSKFLTKDLRIVVLNLCQIENFQMNVKFKKQKVYSSFKDNI